MKVKMERKNKTELLLIIDEQAKSLLKYKSRLHDVVESYKHLVKEKEALQDSIQTLTEAGSPQSPEEEDSDGKTNNLKATSEKNDACLQMLKSSLGALTVEKSRIENELRADRKKLLQQKDDLERSLVEMENNWFLEREKYESQIQELKKKVSSQQREREKEQQDHALMLKELQNLLAAERASKDKLEEQLCELQQKFSHRLPEKRVLEYENCIEDLQQKWQTCRDQLQFSENKFKKQSVLLKALQNEMDNLKTQYSKTVEEEKRRADMAEEKLKLLTVGKENRIANLESRTSELSDMLGNYDKLRQQDLFTIQRLKDKISQLQVECTAISKYSFNESKLWEYGELDKQLGVNKESLANDASNLPLSAVQINSTDSKSGAYGSENVHSICQAEIAQLREELEQCKAKENYNKTSAALLSDAKAGKEIKELRSKVTQLKDQLQASKSQLKLNEEYHNKITTNLEKSIEELKLHHKQELAQVEITNRNQLLELEHQIQKQRERTLSLLEEKDKEIALLKSSFLSSFIKKKAQTPTNNATEEEKENAEMPPSDHEAAASLLSGSLISSKKDGHLLYYVQELSRKDVEISSLRQARIQSESALRKLQQDSDIAQERTSQEIEALKSRIQLLEGKDATNIEYLKNVVLRFLKCSDSNTRQHMVNAIATVLHFTRSEVQEVNAHCKFVRPFK